MVSKKKDRKPQETAGLVSEYVSYWQPRLRINDWDIKVKIVDDPSDADQCVALVEKHLDYQKANLIVLEPKSIPDDWIMWGTIDLEVSVVHELLHLRLAYVNPAKKTRNRAEEMAVETLAVLLVALRRGVNPEDIL